MQKGVLPIGVLPSSKRKSRVSICIFAVLSAAILGSNPAAADCRSGPSPNVEWQDCNKSRLMLGGSDLTGANLAGADFTSTDFRDTNLSGANLEKALLVRASLAGATAKNANFSRVEAYRTSFAGASMPDASFASAEGERADFSGADLTGVDFSKAELGRAIFQKATITGAKFPLANLSRADFQGVVFEGPINFDRAFMFLTQIQGLDLSAATGLTQWQVDLACGDAKTKLPAGLTAPKNWPCDFQLD
ncbi:pentapeptide repeat-containing protein [Mesorhizobium sp. BAC0120]|uniref:pentapeptide repeat-containing protein n=1 Tax=Mesorhizobium sp. BAC0120 TaxID=3090670 RepID=UPI00298CC0ED|nr:pentapeptide repeat-containing protein [Mesorhizobium sp. BAC0120]MDW6025464.1 pentapeptide repeat-containing protein [Mesorhizobium sp. BAC0120]